MHRLRPSSALLRELRPSVLLLVAAGVVVLVCFDFRGANGAAPRQSADAPSAIEKAPVLLPAPLLDEEPASDEEQPTGRLRIPVAGVAPAELTDSFADPRSGGRQHEAIDILAPRGTPVLAATGGTVARLHVSANGGRSLYQLGPDNQRVYYYAHLQRYADGLANGAHVRRGDTLGFVGTTGNAPTGTPHLHFAIWHVADPNAFWDGPAINPYPLLTLSP